MSKLRRWDPCIEHHEKDVEAFLNNYFSDNTRKIIFIAGAGFDPRSTFIANIIAKTKVTTKALLIREERPNPDALLKQKADANTEVLAKLFDEHAVLSFNIFGSDGAVIGGRNALTEIRKHSFEGFSDVIVDVSALSIGTSFPIIRYLVDQIEEGSAPPNCHILVAHDANLDEAAQPLGCDAPGFIHGFKGNYGLDVSEGAAKLWLPQLTLNRRTALRDLFELIKPDDTCPIIPFPARHPRLGDELAEHYITELESTWEVDARNIVYAAENDPLDLYRTILRLDDLRQPVFKELGGSQLILSPAGKVMALGALMAALERNLPVAYLETIGYNLHTAASSETSEPHLVHIWLEGEVYPQPRPKLKR